MSNRYYVWVLVLIVLAVLVTALGVSSIGPRGTLSTITETETSTATVTGSTIIQTTSVVSTTTSIRTTTTTVTLSVNPPPTEAVMTTALGLRLSLVLSNSSLPSGGSITIRMNMTNILSTQNKVPTSWSWPIQMLSWPGEPGCSENSYGYPLGLALFSGYHTVDNLSSAKPLNLTASSIIYGCPNWGPVQYLVFRPSSDMIQAAPPRTTSYSLDVNGTWTGNGTVFSHFAPGLYTVVLGDEWGDVLFLYFTAA